MEASIRRLAALLTTLGGLVTLAIAESKPGVAGRVRMVTLRHLAPLG